MTNDAGSDTENEAALAVYYDGRRDEPDEWAEPVAPPAGQCYKRVTSTITVRFPPDDAERLRRLAKDTELSTSDIIRRAVRAYADAALERTPSPTAVIDACVLATAVTNAWENLVRPDIFTTA